MLLMFISKVNRFVPGWNSGLAVCGIQDAAGANGISPPGRNVASWSATNEAWRFTPNGTQCYTVSWWQGGTQISPVGVSTPTMTVCPTSTTTYTAQIVYNTPPCCINATPVTLTSNVTVTYNNAIGLTVSPTADTICNGGTATFTASSTNPNATFAWSTGSIVSNNYCNAKHYHNLYCYCHSAGMHNTTDSNSYCNQNPVRY